MQNWEARRSARGSSYKPPRSIYQGAFKGLGDDATPSTPDPDPAPPKFEPEPQGSFGGGQGNPTNPRGSGAKPSCPNLNQNLNLNQRKTMKEIEEEIDLNSKEMISL